jgi:hypothetical protein
MKSRRDAADQINATRLLEKDASDMAVQAWYGPFPMLRLIMALIHSDKIRSAYMKRNDISNERIVLDNQILKRVHPLSGNSFLPCGTMPTSLR